MTGLITAFNIRCPACGSDFMHVEETVGLATRFWCEQCPAKPTLEIREYKGNVFIGWDNLSAELCFGETSWSYWPEKNQ